MSRMVIALWGASYGTLLDHIEKLKPLGTMLSGRKKEVHMCKMCMLLALVVVIFSAGCATQQQFLDSNQNMAIQTVMGRAQFEMNCQELTPVVISRK